MMGIFWFFCGSACTIGAAVLGLYVWDWRDRRNQRKYVDIDVAEADVSFFVGPGYSKPPAIITTSRDGINIVGHAFDEYKHARSLIHTMGWDEELEAREAEPRDPGVQV